jgi:hypothetical protein
VIDFCCPRCGTSYHADESHLGRQILCTNGACNEVITIAWQDGRYSRSSNAVQPQAPLHREAHRIDPIRIRQIKRTLEKPALRMVAASAGFICIVGLVLSLGILLNRSDKRSKQSSDTSIKPTDLDRETTLKNSNQGNSQVPIDLSAGEVEIVPDSAASQTGSEHEESQPAQQEFRAVPQRVLLHPVPLKGSEQPVQPVNSLATGTEIVPEQSAAGEGELEATNGTPYDACVIVVDAHSHARVRYTYIKANDTFTLQRLEPGEYDVIFATGIDWDSDAERFNRDASYFDFGSTFTFTETREGQYVKYGHYSITLNPVVGGNVQARSISEREFHLLSGKK